MISTPECVYINWSAYDELSDNVQLTEELAMRQLDELLRLRRLGVKLDYYLMDCFWYEPTSGYREWRKPHWPNGPDRWLAKCLDNDVTPGLWLATNMCAPFCGVAPHPAWRDSLAEGDWSCCMFAGGFLADFVSVMDHWYGRGVRLFKFDFCALSAATPAIERTMLPSEIRQANITALSGALKSFRQTHPDVRLIAYNGFEEAPGGSRNPMSNTSVRLTKFVDSRWLEVFDSLYCGDPRCADVPAINFWRSKDVYSDHMVRVYEANGIPLSRIDSSGFMIGSTGTCYYRGKAAWKGMLLLSLIRGGYINTYYGNLDLLTDDDAKWFARVQRMLLPLQQYGQISTFGPLPGTGCPYGFQASGPSGSVIAVINPSQDHALVELPTSSMSRILFRDAGFVPTVTDNRLTLGPEQLVVLGTGCYASSSFDLGIQEDVLIPERIQRLNIINLENDRAEVCVPPGAKLRVIMRQDEGTARRSTGGAAPNGKSMSHVLGLQLSQKGKPIPARADYDKQIWSGLSWAAVECRSEDVASDPVEIRCINADRGTAKILLDAYAVVDVQEHTDGGSDGARLRRPSSKVHP